MSKSFKTLFYEVSWLNAKKFGEVKNVLCKLKNKFVFLSAVCHFQNNATVVLGYAASSASCYNNPSFNVKELNVKYIL